MDEIIHQLERLLEKQSLKENDGMSPKQLQRILKQSGAPAYGLKHSAFEDEKGLQDTAQMIRASASKLPSAGIAMCMHQHVVLACARHADLFETTGEMLKAVAEHNALVGSAFAEGLPGADIFMPSVHAERDGEHYRLHGSKKPCTMSSIADFFVVSCSLNKSVPHIAIAIVPTKSQNIGVERFWALDVLQASDSHEVVFNGQIIEARRMSRRQGEALQAVLGHGMATFNLFAAAAYSGCVDALIERLPARVLEVPAIAREIMGFQLTSQALITSMSGKAHQADQDETSVGEILALRYQLEELITKTVSFVMQTAGGIGVITNPDLFYLQNVTQLYKYHAVTRFQLLNQLLSEQ